MNKPENPKKRAALEKMWAARRKQGEESRARRAAEKEAASKAPKPPKPKRGTPQYVQESRYRDLLEREITSPGTIEALLKDYEFAARDKQRIPDPEPRIWLIQSGRGWGKTWTGAHWVRQQIERGCKQGLAIGPTATDVHDVMVPMLMEVLGPSAAYRRTMDAPTVTYLGATIHLRSGQRIDRSRGLNVGFVWADEIDSWRPEQHTPHEAWLAVVEPACRIPPARFLITSTPKRGGIVAWFNTRSDVQITRGHTRENADNLADGVIKSLEEAFAGSWLERQELGGEIVTEVKGALVTVQMIEQGRVLEPPADQRMTVVAVDPSGGRDEQGIVVACLDPRKHVYVLADRSCRLAPDGWGRRAIGAWDEFGADRIVAEKNYGGDMVLSTLRTIDQNVPIRVVSASRAKHVRFEPVAALYEQGRIHHVGPATAYERLETEVTGFTAKGYEGVGESPNRADALAWAVAELLQRRGPSAKDLYGKQGWLAQYEANRLH